ncbi:MAG: DUF2029 domain-containing protein [Candidatus Brocadia sp.]|nr:DUF2029 domain-containing protein [Candidatus Brocadia sp.]MDG6026968.1 DUF2029 domain-containing protein [Candidatus Brocadia sp.]
MLLLLNCLQKLNFFLYEVGIIFTAALCFLPFIVKHQKTLNYIWVVLCILLIVLNILLTYTYFYCSGWDVNIYCAAVKVFNNNGNPYLIHELQKLSSGALPFVYPPISIYFFKILCYLICIFDSKASYYFLWCLFLTGAFFIIRNNDKNFKPLLLILLFTTGFLATYWNYLTGNIGLLELFLLSICFSFAIKEKYYLAMFPLAFLALLKITPLALVSFFIFSGISKYSKLKVVSFGLILFIFFSSLSYVLFPDITHSYYLSLMGKIENQNSPIYENGGIGNPSLFFLVKNIAETLFSNNFTIFLIIYILLIGFVFTLFLNYTLKKNRNFLEILSTGILFFLIVSPRLKPYSFTFALIPVYFLIKDFDVRYKFLSIFIVSVIPLLMLRLHIFASIAGNVPAFPKALLKYNQSICLLCFFILALTYDSFRNKLVKYYV